jgi:transposase
MADHVGAGAAVLTPLYELIKAHVFAAERIHGDDTTVPVLAKIKTRTGRLWAYVRDDRPFGAEPIRPRLCSSTHPIGPVSTPQRHLAGYSGFLQADAYAGFNTVTSGVNFT